MTTLDSFKLAAPKKENKEESHLGRNLAMGAAAALPFAGMIGEQPVIHSNKGDVHTNLQEFMKTTKPGDMVISGDSDPSLMYRTIGAFTGTSKGHHVSVISGPNGQVYDANAHDGLTRATIDPYNHMQVLRPNVSTDKIVSYLEHLDKFTDAHKDLSKPIARRTFDVTGDQSAGRNALRDLFLPKLVDEQKIKRHASRVMKARNNIIDTPKILNLLETRPYSRGNQVYCSTLPSVPLGGLVPGKLPHRNMPGDLLRSTKLSPVSRFIPKGAIHTPIADALTHNGPNLIRAGTGLALAGGVYGVNKLYHHFADGKKKQQPK